jgi:putative peptidoglycan lipid II flippase
MVAGTIITLVMLPVYWAMHAHFGAMGLAWASNIAILAHTLTLAVLLHTRRLVPLWAVERAELAKSLLASVASALLVALLLRELPTHHGHLWNALLLLAGTLVWGGAGFAMLKLTGSRLPAQILRRRTV